MDENDVEVTLSDGALTLQGEKKAEEEQQDQHSYRVERSYGAFRRSVVLPAGVNPEQVAATFKKGVLTVTLPKTAPVQPQAKRIVIKTAE